MAGPMAAHDSAVYMDAALFARFDALHERRAALGLTPEQRRLLERIHLDFVRGAGLLVALASALAAGRRVWVDCVSVLPGESIGAGSAPADIQHQGPERVGMAEVAGVIQLQGGRQQHHIAHRAVFFEHEVGGGIRNPRSAARG